MNGKSVTQLDQEKQLAARSALEWVKSGMRLGLGSGSTAYHFIRFLGEKVQQGQIKVEAIAASRASETLARQFQIPLLDPERGLRLDLAVDGADEIGPGLSLIKGGGGALLREKVIARAADQFLVIADSSKRVSQLGAFPLPVEVIGFAVPWVMDELARLGSKTALRMGAGSSAYLTDQQNNILDCNFGVITDPQALAAKLEAIPGIAEHGLFLNYAHAALIAGDGDVTLVRRDSR